MWRLLVVASLCAGCDLYFGGSDPAPDAPLPPDGNVPDPDGETFELTRVIVYSTDGTSLLPDTLVHFISPDQQIVAVMTDVEGTASASTPPDSTIVVFQSDESGQAPLVKIFVGTQPGDTVIAGRRRQQGSGPLGEVTFQLGVPPGGASAYHFRSSCIGPVIKTTPTFTLPLISCPHVTNATAIAWAVDSTDTPVTGPSVFRGLNLSGAGDQPIQMPGYQPLIGSTFAFDHGFTNIPLDATEKRWIERFFVGVDTIGSESDVTLPSGPVTMFTEVDWSIHTLEYKPAQFGAVRVDSVQHNGASPFVFDASAMIRGVRNATYDAATSSVIWEEQSTGLPATLINARLTLTNTDRRLTIELHGPNDGSHAIALPPLPEEVSFGAQESVLVDLSGQIIVDRLPMDVLVQRSYSAMLGDVDTNFAFTPVYWDPAFAGKVLEARAQ